jgi:hypothetical protein
LFPEQLKTRLREVDAVGADAREIVAPAMGHRDTRMVERVYGLLSPEEMLSAHFADCIAGVADKVDWTFENR